jgi:hypothetical protein
MSIETGLLVMSGVFVLVWLVFVIYGEVIIARERRTESADTDSRHRGEQHA